MSEHGFDECAATEIVSRTMVPSDRLFYEADEITAPQAVVLDRLQEWGISATPHTRLRSGLEHLSLDPGDYVWDGVSFLARIRVGNVHVPAAMLMGRSDKLELAEDFAEVQVAYWWSVIERKLREGAIQ